MKFGKQPEQQSEGQEVASSPSNTSRRPKTVALWRNCQQLTEILYSKLKDEKKKKKKTKKHTTSPHSHLTFISMTSQKCERHKHPVSSLFQTAQNGERAFWPLKMRHLSKRQEDLSTRKSSSLSEMAFDNFVSQKAKHSQDFAKPPNFLQTSKLQRYKSVQAGQAEHACHLIVT